MGKVNKSKVISKIDGFDEKLKKIQEELENTNERKKNFVRVTTEAYLKENNISLPVFMEYVDTIKEDLREKTKKADNKLKEMDNDIEKAEIEEKFGLKNNTEN